MDLLLSIFYLFQLNKDILRENLLKKIFEAEKTMPDVFPDLP